MSIELTFFMEFDKIMTITTNIKSLSLKYKNQ